MDKMKLAIEMRVLAANLIRCADHIQGEIAETEELETEEYCCCCNEIRPLEHDGLCRECWIENVYRPAEEAGWLEG